MSNSAEAKRTIRITISDESAVKLKNDYNERLERYKKGCIFMDNKDVPIEAKEKWLPDFQSIISDLGNILYLLREAGFEVSDDDIDNGFKIV